MTLDDSCSLHDNVDITKEDINKRLKNLKVNKAPGVDEIVPRILIENADYLSQPLEYIYRESLETGVVPSEWKQANVTPIYKKGPRELSCNYRPVSLTSHICKVLESIIRDSLVDYLHRNNLIRDTQHGFVKKRSCLTNLLEFLEFVSSYIDRGFPVDVIYLDFQKAFDKVPHRRLMLKINSLGISGSIFKWIENWLQDREQKVVMLGSSSRWIKVKSGVPQGSVLGPLLFLIYINDIDEVVASKILKFADDTKLYGVVANQQDIERLKNDLKNLCNWSADWLMLFNVDKCKVMHFRYNNSKSTYEMNGKDLEEISEERDLGVIVQQDLKWSKQCSKSVSTANRVLGMIKISFCYLSKDVVLKLYKSLVRPHLEYCVQAWRPYLKKDIELIERVTLEKLPTCSQLVNHIHWHSIHKHGKKLLIANSVRILLLKVTCIFQHVFCLPISRFMQPS
jgi:hypothetical protein